MHMFCNRKFMTTPIVGHCWLVTLLPHLIQSASFTQQTHNYGTRDQLATLFFPFWVILASHNLLSISKLPLQRYTENVDCYTRDCISQTYINFSQRLSTFINVYWCKGVFHIFKYVCQTSSWYMAWWILMWPYSKWDNRDQSYSTVWGIHGKCFNNCITSCYPTWTLISANPGWTIILFIHKNTTFHQ